MDLDELIRPNLNLSVKLLLGVYPAEQLCVLDDLLVAVSHVDDQRIPQPKTVGDVVLSSGQFKLPCAFGAEARCCYRSLGRELQSLGASLALGSGFRRVKKQKCYSLGSNQHAERRILLEFGDELEDYFVAVVGEVIEVPEDCFYFVSLQLVLE